MVEIVVRWGHRPLQKQGGHLGAYPPVIKCGNEYGLFPFKPPCMSVSIAEFHWPCLNTRGYPNYVCYPPPICQHIPATKSLRHHQWSSYVRTPSQLLNLVCDFGSLTSLFERDHVGMQIASWKPGLCFVLRGKCPAKFNHQPPSILQV